MILCRSRLINDLLMLMLDGISDENQEFCFKATASIEGSFPSWVLVVMDLAVALTTPESEGFATLVASLTDIKSTEDMAWESAEDARSRPISKLSLRSAELISLMSRVSGSGATDKVATKPFFNMASDTISPPTEWKRQEFIKCWFPEGARSAFSYFLNTAARLADI